MQVVLKAFAVLQLESLEVRHLPTRFLDLSFTAVSEHQVVMGARVLRLQASRNFQFLAGLFRIVLREKNLRQAEVWFGKLRVELHRALIVFGGLREIPLTAVDVPDRVL